MDSDKRKKGEADSLPHYCGKLKEKQEIGMEDNFEIRNCTSNFEKNINNFKTSLSRRRKRGNSQLHKGVFIFLNLFLCLSAWIGFTRPLNVFPSFKGGGNKHRHQVVLQKRMEMVPRKWKGSEVDFIFCHTTATCAVDVPDWNLLSQRWKWSLGTTLNT